MTPQEAKQSLEMIAIVFGSAVCLAPIAFGVIAAVRKSLKSRSSNDYENHSDSSSQPQASFGLSQSANLDQRPHTERPRSNRGATPSKKTPRNSIR